MRAILFVPKFIPEVCAILKLPPPNFCVKDFKKIFRVSETKAPWILEGTRFPKPQGPFFLCVGSFPEEITLDIVNTFQSDFGNG